MPIFLKIPGTPGSSKHKQHLNEFELESLQWGMSRRLPTRDHERPLQPPPGEFFGTTHDARSGGLLLLAMDGQAVTMEATFLKQDKDVSAPYLRITLENALMVSVHVDRSLISFSVHAASVRHEVLQAQPAASVLAPAQGQAGVKPAAGKAQP